MFSPQQNWIVRLCFMSYFRRRVASVFPILRCFGRCLVSPCYEVISYLILLFHTCDLLGTVYFATNVGRLRFPITVLVYSSGRLNWLSNTCI